MTDRRTKKAGRGKRPAGDYEVGYGRPPRATQFKPGQSRPPRKPRPERKLTFEDYLVEELEQPMRFVDESGREQEMPKLRVLAKMVANRAVKNGDLKQIREFIPRAEKRDGDEISQADLGMIARFLASAFPNPPSDPIEVSEDDSATPDADKGGQDE